MIWNWYKDIISAFIVKRQKNLQYIGEKACCSRNGVVLQWKAPNQNIIKAEVKKTADTKIVILVKKNHQYSCEFGAELLGDLYNIIQKYRIFQDEQEKPAIKICFKDKKGREKNCEIDEILEEGSLIESIVLPTVWDILKNIACEIGKKLHFKLTADGKFKSIQVGVEFEIDGKNDNT